MPGPNEVMKRNERSFYKFVNQFDDKDEAKQLLKDIFENKREVYKPFQKIDSPSINGIYDLKTIDAIIKMMYKYNLNISLKNISKKGSLLVTIYTKNKDLSNFWKDVNEYLIIQKEKEE